MSSGSRESSHHFASAQAASSSLGLYLPPVFGFTSPPLWNSHRSHPRLDSAARASLAASLAPRTAPLDQYRPEPAPLDDSSSDTSYLTLESPVAGNAQPALQPPHSYGQSIYSLHSTSASSRPVARAPIDLTQASSPFTMPPAHGTKRRNSALHHDSDDASPATASKRRRSSNDRSRKPKQIEQIDLSGGNDEIAATLQKQREDQIRSQQATVPVGKSKLTSLQCTVCLEPPTDLTATSCGHVFCRTCLMDWLVSAEKDGMRRPNCPACRKHISLRTQLKTRKDVVPLVFMRKPVR